jgi:DNA-binding GntR family transcriptional regulator
VSIERRRDRDAVTVALDAVRAMIVTGRLAPGTELSQVDLARTIGTSTTPLREALRRLEAEGLVEQRRNRRPRVPPFDPDDLDAVYSNRILLESLGIALAVPHMTAADIAALRADLARMRSAAAAPPADDWDPAHAAFHDRLVDRCTGPLRGQIAGLMARSDRYRRLAVLGDEPGGRRVGQAEHEAIVAACAAADGPRAALLLARHLARSALAVAAHLAPGADAAGVRGALRMVTGWADAAGREEPGPRL